MIGPNIGSRLVGRLAVYDAPNHAGLDKRYYILLPRILKPLNCFLTKPLGQGFCFSL